MGRFLAHKEEKPEMDKLAAVSEHMSQGTLEPALPEKILA